MPRLTRSSQQEPGQFPRSEYQVPISSHEAFQLSISLGENNLCVGLVGAMIKNFEIRSKKKKGTSLQNTLLSQSSLLSESENIIF